ncbi:hypothetical protein MMC24_002679 [Lignoscripta atroalba]|nr:hypothetical protein [Lignoscripta atroalba]
MTSISVYGYDQQILGYGSSDEESKSCQDVGSLRLAEAATQCFLLQLPLELREHIYRCILPRTIDTGTKGIAWLRGTTSILATSKQIHSEAAKIFYANNTFVLDVVWDCSTFVYQWLLPSGLIPKHTMAFPDHFSPRNRALMRKFYIRVHHVDSYTGMVKYNYGGHGLIDGTRDQVRFLCQTLRSLASIHSLHIHLQDDSTTSTAPNDSAQTMLEPFLDLKNTLRISTSGSITPAFSQKLHALLTDANSQKDVLPTLT